MRPPTASLVHVARSPVFGIRRDAGVAVRQLGRNLGFATVAALTLALGIGATTAVFAVVDAMLRPGRSRTPAHLVLVGGRSRAQPCPVSCPTLSTAPFGMTPVLRIDRGRRPGRPSLVPFGPGELRVAAPPA